MRRMQAVDQGGHHLFSVPEKADVGPSLEDIEDEMSLHEAELILLEDVRER